MAVKGAYMRALRRSKKLTQQDLAEKIKADQSDISALETGNRKNPRVMTMFAIARALECSIDDLVDKN